MTKARVFCFSVSLVRHKTESICFKNVLSAVNFTSIFLIFLSNSILNLYRAYVWQLEVF